MLNKVRTDYFMLEHVIECQDRTCHVILGLVRKGYFS